MSLHEQLEGRLVAPPGVGQQTVLRDVASLGHEPILSHL
jgi:hypothetical protein